MKNTVEMERSSAPGLEVVTLSRGDHQEFFITSTALEGERVRDTLKRAAHAVSQRRAAIISQDLFALDMTFLNEFYSHIHWPITCVMNGSEHGTDGFGGTQLHAVSGKQVEPVRIQGKVVGSRWSDGSAAYCRLGGLESMNRDKPETDQAHETFSLMQSTLTSVGMDFSHVVRTWFYFERILDWYNDFNRVRHAFFRKHGVYEGRVPASTGMGGPNPAGTALVAGLVALKPLLKEVKIQPLASPLQCPALDYGSSFSRAMEIRYPGERRILVSGTASISPEGKTLHAGRTEDQIQRTLEVVEAILKSRSMDLSHVTRAVAYLKHAEDLPLFRQCLRQRELFRFPVVHLENHVCWDDLLFEIEVDAVKGEG